MKKKFAILLIMVTTTLSIAGQKKTFLRVYDVHGRKITKGFITGTTDTSVLIGDGDLINSIPAKKIGRIKTKRSIGHSILMTGLFIGTSSALLSLVATAGLSRVVSTPRGKAFVSGFFIGAGIGGALGGFWGAAKKINDFNINGNLENWRKLRPVIDQLYAGPVNTQN
jgi:hypothetical protein